MPVFQTLLAENRIEQRILNIFSRNLKYCLKVKNRQARRKIVNKIFKAPDGTIHGVKNLVNAFSDIYFDTKRC